MTKSACDCYYQFHILAQEYMIQALNCIMNDLLITCFGIKPMIYMSHKLPHL